MVAFPQPRINVAVHFKMKRPSFRAVTTFPIFRPFLATVVIGECLVLRSRNGLRLSLDSQSPIGQTKGGMNTKLQGRPIRLHVTAGQISDYTGAAALIETLPKVDWLLADRGYDAAWSRKRLKDQEIKPCIPGRKSRKKAIKYDKRRSGATVSKSCLED